MKKILFVVLIFTGVVCNAQTGLVLRGQSITNSQDSVTYSTFYTIPQFCSGYNRTFQLVFPLYRSAYAAKYLPSQVLNFTGLPVLQNTIIDTAANPNFYQLLLLDTAYLHNQGFSQISIFK